MSFLWRLECSGLYNSFEINSLGIGFLIYAQFFHLNIFTILIFFFINKSTIRILVELSCVNAYK